MNEVAGGVWQAAYIVAALSIVLSIKWLSSPVTARRGVMSGELGLLFAIIGTLLRAEVVNYEWILISIAIGAAIGAPLAYLMPMTSVPQLTALSHAFGALAAALVGTAEYYKDAALDHPTTGAKMVALVIEILLGYLTCTASVMAFGKLQEIVPTRPLTYKGQNFVNLFLFAIAMGLGVWMIVEPAPDWAFPVFTGIVAAVRRAADSSDRRWRHADCDRAAEFLRGRCLRGHGIRSGESVVDHRGRGERIIGIYSVGDHVQRHESIFRQRALRRVRAGAGRRGCESILQAGALGDARRRRVNSGECS